MKGRIHSIECLTMLDPFDERQSLRLPKEHTDEFVIKFEVKESERREFYNILKSMPGVDWEHKLLKNREWKQFQENLT